MLKVMIDAGHVGYANRSPAVPEYYESVMAWKLHLLWVEEFAKYEDVSVGTTRADIDVDLDPYYRGAAANGYDVFFSLHSNAIGSYVNDNIDHPIVIHQLDDNTKLPNLLSNVIADVMQTREAGRVGTKSNDYGGEWYGVLRGSKAVGTRGYIVEHSFHTATAPSKWLLDDDNLALLAEREVAQIADFYELKKKESEDEAMIEELKERVETLEKRNAILEDKVTKLQPRIYRYWSDLEDNAEWYYKPIWALHEAGLFSGRSPSNLDLSEDLARSLTCLAASLKVQGIINY